MCTENMVLEDVTSSEINSDDVPQTLLSSMTLKYDLVKECFRGGYTSQW